MTKHLRETSSNTPQISNVCVCVYFPCSFLEKESVLRLLGECEDTETCHKKCEARFPSVAEVKGECRKPAGKQRGLCFCRF